MFCNGYFAKFCNEISLCFSIKIVFFFFQSCSDKVLNLLRSWFFFLLFETFEGKISFKWLFRKLSKIWPEFRKYHKSSKWSLDESDNRDLTGNLWEEMIKFDRNFSKSSKSGFSWFFRQNFFQLAVQQNQLNLPKFSYSKIYHIWMAGAERPDLTGTLCGTKLVKFATLWV